MDDPKRKITIPEWQIPYLEKHNIYKLFSELARELVIQQPEDHVYFVKLLLSNAIKNIHTPHTIILSAPNINVVEIGRQIASQTEQVIVSEEDVLKALGNQAKDLRIRDYIRGIQSVLNSNATDVMKHGWILIDLIKTKEQAQKLLESGILPTHVLYLIPPFVPNLTDLLYCDVPSYWPAFRREMLGITQIFHKKLIEVHLNEFLIHDAVNKCVELTKIERIQEGPKQPRVVLIGPRGSGRKTQAKLLKEKLNLVHIDFEYLLCQAWISDTDIGKELRKQGNQACFQSKLLCQVLNKRLLEPDCLSQGWVLTGYPFCLADFKEIDLLYTPPNRVVFLECDLSICHDRLMNRGINVYTGSETKLEADVNIDEITEKRLKLHPKNRADIIDAELKYYCTQYGSLRKYCGGTASVVNADQPERWVHESITAIIIRDLPISSPRDPSQ